MKSGLQGSNTPINLYGRAALDSTDNLDYFII